MTFFKKRPKITEMSTFDLFDLSGLERARMT